ncbi:MAG: prolyl-tRNA synthetase associated domain-containing protein [Clostridia bacterium]|nr:prolyl-tRNA synthetase associated domain-containing protein [Clostridia bacterium]
MNVYKGRPNVTEGREARELAVYDTLDALGIKYDRADHGAAMTMEDCRETDDALGVRMCKNLFLCNRQKTDFYLLLMPADKPFKTKELSAQIGSARLSFASAEDMERYLGVSPGAVSVMGLMNDTDKNVKLLVDGELASNEYIGCHPCVNTSSLKIRTADVFRTFLAFTGHEITYVKLTGAE